MGRAWVPKGQSSRSKNLYIGGKRYTTLAAMSIDGVLARKTFEGPATKEIFTSFFVYDVLPLMDPFPEKHSVLVMDDNCALNDEAESSYYTELIRAIMLLHPPYTPTYNPMECLFGAIKQWLKSNRDIVPLMDPYSAIDLAIDSVTPAMCEAWIRRVEYYNAD
eukprot:gene31427-6603_t